MKLFMSEFPLHQQEGQAFFKDGQQYQYCQTEFADDSKEVYIKYGSVEGIAGLLTL